MPGRTIRTFTVLPSLPERLHGLHELAYNLWWCWNPDAVALFRRIDPDLFESLDNSPVRLLGATPQARWEELAADDGFLAHLDRVLEHLHHYRTSHTWFHDTYGELDPQHRVAYFSAEFGLHESIPVYSGGLGVLAGDHLKSASDLGIPLIGVGLFYDQGYFRQRLDRNGWQQEEYLDTDVAELPMELAIGANGEPVLVQIKTRTGPISARVWRLKVGRCDVILLDSNIAGNAPEDRHLTSRLYGGDGLVRIRQVFLLGVGGFCTMRDWGIIPCVLLLNEEHK